MFFSIFALIFGLFNSFQFLLQEIGFWFYEKIAKSPLHPTYCPSLGVPPTRTKLLPPMHHPTHTPLPVTYPPPPPATHPPLETPFNTTTLLVPPHTYSPTPPKVTPTYPTPITTRTPPPPPQHNSPTASYPPPQPPRTPLPYVLHKNAPPSRRSTQFSPLRPRTRPQKIKKQNYVDRT